MYRVYRKKSYAYEVNFIILNEKNLNFAKNYKWNEGDSLYEKYHLFVIVQI